jgi:hypothetical protein
MSRRTRAEHDTPISKVQKCIGGVGLESIGGFIVANLAPSTVIIQIGGFQMSITQFLKSTYCSNPCGESFARLKLEK